MTRNGKSRGKKSKARSYASDAVPLDDSARRTMGAGCYRLANVHLAEAEAILKWGKAPNACTHAAYYAMHHCAAGALYLAGGVGKLKAVPKSHEHVIEHFAELVSVEGAELQAAAEMLNFARTMRVKSDYGLVIGGVDHADSVECVNFARTFIPLVSARWKVELPEDAMGNLWLSRNLDAIPAAKDQEKK